MHTQSVQITSLLELLGFVVNREKSQLLPAQVIHYLGFMVDSKEMKIRLSEEKATQISTTCRKIRERGFISVRELARLIGKMTATLPAIFPASLWYRKLQRMKNQTYQRSQSFEAIVTLNQEALLELDWWSIRRNLMDGKSVSTQEPDLTMETDASMLGWGAVFQGSRTGGLGAEEPHQLSGTPRSVVRSESICQRQEEHSYPSEDGQQDSSVLCEMNGGDPFPSVEQPGNSTLAVVLGEEFVHHSRASPGVDNCVADKESRVIQLTAEWQLHRPIFQQILEFLGNCNIDLFATRLNVQLKQFVSWRPDPDSVGADALQLPWNRWEGYAFPPFCLIGRCQEGQRGQGFSDTSSTSLEVTAVVPSITRTVS